MAEQGLREFDAPEGGQLCTEIVAAYDDAGVIILKDFVSFDECNALKRQASKLVEAFDPGEVQSVSSTTKQTQLDDRDFLESGDKIRVVLEGDAFDETCVLRQIKENSLNKTGHAMQVIDRSCEYLADNWLQRGPGLPLRRLA